MSISRRRPTAPALTALSDPIPIARRRRLQPPRAVRLAQLHDEYTRLAAAPLPLGPDVAYSPRLYGRRRDDLLELVDMILDGPACLAATTYADARRLALALHDDRSEYARDALSVTLNNEQIATAWHAVAEWVAELAADAGSGGAA